MAKMKTRQERQTFFYWFRQVHGETSWTKPNEWRYMPYGAKRRELLLAYLKKHGPIPVNNKWQVNTHWDADVKRLLKKGVLKMYKTGGVGKRQTYIDFQENV